MNEYAVILDAIRANPARWLALAGWLADNGRDDEAAAVRMFYPALQDNLVPGATLDHTLEIVRRNAARLARRARLLEEQSVCQRSRD